MTEQVDENSWTVVQAELDGRLAWLRIQNDIGKTIRDSNPHRMIVRWKYEDDGEDGMPPLELKDKYHALEEALVSSIQSDDTGVLALVLTTAGCRQWHIHFSDAQAIQGSVNRAFADMPDMPISLTGKFDPDWTEYSYFSSTLADE